MTLPIDLQFRGIGRVHVRSGTTKKAVRDAMRDMLRTLYQMGRADLIREVKAGRVTPLQVYDRYRIGKLNELPTGELNAPLTLTWTQWLTDKEVKPNTRRDYTKAITRVTKHVAPGASISELPAALKLHRKDCRDQRPRTFNKDKAAALSFLSSLVGERHWLYAECARVESLKVMNPMRKNPQTLTEIKALAEKLEPHHAVTLWAYYLTGMRPEEMFEQEDNTWTLESDRVRVHGTKTPASLRVVPRVGLLVKPATKRRAFAKALSLASDTLVTPYDIRRSYAQLLDLARIPQFRQDYYMAHGPTNLNELYKRAKECEQYLTEDAAAIEALVSTPAAMRIVR